MFEIILWILGGFGALLGIAALVWIFHRVCTRLEEAGYQVITAVNGAKAWDLLQKPDLPDLVKRDFQKLIADYQQETGQPIENGQKAPEALGGHLSSP